MIVFKIVLADKIIPIVTRNKCTLFALLKVCTDMKALKITTQPGQLKKIIKKEVKCRLHYMKQFRNITLVLLQILERNRPSDIVG